MSGVDPSRLVRDLQSSLFGLQQLPTPRGKPRGSSESSWEEWLGREQTDSGGSREVSGVPILPARTEAGLSLPDLLESLIPVVPSKKWVEAVSSLRSLGERWATQARGGGQVENPGEGSTGAFGSPAGRVARQQAAGLVPSQFDPSLSPREANAACGPAAAVAFARASGRDLSLREAVELAKTVGWTPAGGMNGVANQKRLLEKIGVPVKLDGSGDWGRIVQTVSAGTPVTISTPGHYFVADGYDPKTGRFHVGASGTSYRNGKEWMTREEMEGLAGRLNGSLVMDTRRNWMA